MNIQKVIERIRILSSFWVPIFVFLLPAGLMYLSGTLNHNYAIRVATEMGLDSVRIKASGYFILATGALLFSYPFVLSHFKMDNTLDKAEQKMLKILLIVAICPYAILIIFDLGTKFYKGTLFSVSTLFDVAQVLIAMGFEYAAGILALPIRKLMFSETIGKSSNSMSTPSKSSVPSSLSSNNSGSGSGSTSVGSKPPIAPVSGPT